MSIYGVYIIESLRSEDYTDGENLHEILKLSLIKTNYEWVESKEDLAQAIRNFAVSKFRYLHISSHADQLGFEINSEEVANFEFQKMTQRCLKNKRVFLSVCEGANRDLASRIISKNRAYSLVGIPIKVPFDKSALFWPSFYHLLNELDEHKMKRDDMINILKKLVKLFGIPINYYSRIDSSNKYIRRFKIRDSSMDNRKIKVNI
jgi:hypothetical protein